MNKPLYPGIFNCAAAFIFRSFNFDATFILIFPSGNKHKIITIKHPNQKYISIPLYRHMVFREVPVWVNGTDEKLTAFLNSYSSWQTTENFLIARQSSSRLWPTIDHHQCRPDADVPLNSAPCSFPLRHIFPNLLFTSWS